MQERHLFSISKELLNSVNSHLYNGDAHYTYGSYSFTEIELNEMKGMDDYYVTDYTIPIANAIPFDSIREPPQVNISSIHRQITDLYGDLPEKKGVDIQCRQCHLHFSSERQLKRHQRTHLSSSDIMEEAPTSERVEEPVVTNDTRAKRHEKVSEEKAKRLALGNEAEEVQLDTADGSLLLQRDDVGMESLSYS